MLHEMAQPLMKALPARLILPALAVLESQIRCLAVTPTVIDMNEPKVPLWLHARSWIPGGTYLAERGERVRPLSAKKPEKALQHVDVAESSSIALVAESVSQKKRGARVNVALEKVLEHLAPKDIVYRPNQHPDWWGSKDTAQIVLAPSNLGAAARQAIEAQPAADDIPARELVGATAPVLSAPVDEDSAEHDLQEDNG
ncbi:hypothetical protein [Nesterenkonia sp.]|uniref:hypothetical protein n=1 Tax=Nesterenkonia sp. TaxID=704201 RepID=UPI00261F69C6|nr:hypothetical protein [Nesterenkonia sp.]